MDVNNEYGVLKMQKELLTFLKQFHSFCIENDIKYSLDWGSLLGVVRHNGFIPWDDDLDIMVDRENNEKIVNLIEKKSGLKYDFISPETLWIGRIHPHENYTTNEWQPTIDILIMDNAPDSCIARKWRLLLVLALQGMLKLHPIFTKGNIVMRICRFITFYIGKLFSRKIKLKLYHHIAQLSNQKKTKQKTCYYEEYSCLGKYYPSNILDSVMLMKFEDMEVYVVKDYHLCLCTQFGADYMTPPPINERIPRHI